MRINTMLGSIKLLIISVCILIIIFVGVWASQQRQGISERAAANSVSLLIVPQNNGNEIITENTQFVREIVIHNPSGLKIVNYEMSVSFPSSLLEVVTIDTSMSPLPIEVVSTFDNPGGTIKLSRVDIGTTPTTLESLSIARITFKARASSGSAHVMFTEQIVSGAEIGSTVVTQIPVESVQNGTYVLSSGPTSSVPTATPTTIATPPHATVLLTTTAFLLQGRDYTGASQNLPALVSIKNTQHEWNTMISSGTIANVLLTGTNAGSYVMVLKPEGYLAREISQTLTVGQNTISLTNILFCAGDIDGNDIVNSFDHSELLKDYGKGSGRSDLDGSGQVNSLDFSLLLSNFSETPSTQQCAPEE